MSEEAPTEAQPTPEGATPEQPTPEGAKKKKKRKGGARAEPMTPVELPGEGTPEGELLREANASFEAGNYARVRELTTKLATASDPKVVDASADLLRRVSLDPMQLIFLTVCVCVLVAITYIYILS